MLTPHDEGVLATIRDLMMACDELDAKPVLIGGIAVGLVARERATRDVDAMVLFDTGNVDQLLASLERNGFRPGFNGMAEFARQDRFVSLQHRSGVKLDLALGCLPLEEEILARSTTKIRSEIVFRLPTPEDLIILKAIANRPQDRADIHTIAEVHPNIRDRAQIRYWVDQYAELLEDPELWQGIELLLG